MLICEGCYLNKSGKKIIKDKTTLYGFCYAGIFFHNKDYLYYDNSCYPIYVENC